MTEITLSLEELNPNDFMGVNNAHLKFIQAAFPKTKIVCRGNELKIIGDEHEITEAAQKIRPVIDFVTRSGHISAARLADLLSITAEEPEIKPVLDDDVLVYGPNGKLIKVRTANQRKMVESLVDNDILFAIGPAGTGKTYTAVALAVQALKNKQIKRIILTRPAVEAGENLGFLPGDLKEKIDPYLRPLYDALDDMIPAEKLKTYLETRIIEVAPLAFMRGRTLDHAFVILDEAQNATDLQLRMFLTRMGPHAKFIITGDVTQIDLPRNQQSGLPRAAEILKSVSGIKVVYLTMEDVVRHRLVRDIIKAYGEQK